MRNKWWIWKLKVRLFFMGFGEAIAKGFWLMVGDVLWGFPNWRDRYYAYRESCWRNAQDAMSFAWWLRSGNWRNS